MPYAPATRYAQLSRGCFRPPFRGDCVPDENRPRPYTRQPAPAIGWGVARPPALSLRNSEWSPPQGCVPNDSFREHSEPTGRQEQHLEVEPQKEPQSEDYTLG